MGYPHDSGKLHMRMWNGSNSLTRSFSIAGTPVWPRSFWSHIVVSWNRGTPKSSTLNTLIYRMFHYKPSSYWGSHIYGHLGVSLQSSANRWSICPASVDEIESCNTQPGNSLEDQGTEPLFERMEFRATVMGFLFWFSSISDSSVSQDFVCYPSCPLVTLFVVVHIRQSWAPQESTGSLSLYITAPLKWV